MCFLERPTGVVVSHGAEGLMSEKNLRTQFYRVCSIGDPLTVDQMINCRSLIKVKFLTNQVRRALGSGGCLLFDCHLTKLINLKTALFRLFQPDAQILLPILPYTDLLPPSTDPVPSYIADLPAVFF